MSPPKPTASATSTTTTRTNFPSITACDVSSINHHSIAADLDGTLLISRSSFPYFMLVAIEAGSFLRGLALLLSFPLIAIAYTFLSEALAIQMLIFISFSGLKIRDIELASRAVLTKFYAADVNSESWEVFDKCERKVVVTANPTVMVEHFVREYLGGHTVLGTEIEVNPKTKRATGFVKKPGVLVGKLKKLAILKEFGDESPDIGIGDRQSDHDFMSCCKGVLLGLSNTAGVLAGVFGTAATGYILQKGSWDDVFKVSVALYIIGTLVWNIFSTGRRDAAYISKEIKQ